MNLKYFLKSVFPPFLILTALSCSSEPSSSENVVATVDGRKITLDQFRNFYELDPNFGIDNRGTDELFNELEKMLCYKLALMKGKEAGWTEDPSFVSAVEWEKSRAMLRELYREEVGRKVTVTDEELREEYRNSLIGVHVRHLFSRDSAQVQEWRKEILNGASFDSIAGISFADTILARNGGDLGWTSLNELDEDFASAIRNLKKDELSDIVRTRWGYHIIQLVNREDRVFITEDELQKNRQSLEKRIRNRKGAELSKKYIADYIGDLNPQPVGRTLQRLWIILTGIEGSRKELTSPLLLTDNHLDRISEQLAPLMNQTLITYKNGRVTLGEYLDALKKIPRDNRPRVESIRDFSEKLGIWIRDKLLLEEAYRRNIQRSEAVEREVADFKEQQSYNYLFNRQYSEVVVPEEVKEYFEKRNRPDIQLDRFHNLQEWVGWNAEKSLHRSLMSMPVDIRIDSTLVRRENRNIDWTNRVRMFVIPKPE